jgi:hypothetical protein
MSAKLEKLSGSKVVWALVLLLCLGLRIGAMYYKGDSEVTDKDAGIWMGIAESLRSGYGFSFGKESYEKKIPTAYSEPGYPAFLALVYQTVGDDLFDIYTAQSVLDTVTCLIVMLLAVKATRGRMLAGVLAGLAYSVYPPFIISAVSPMTETFGTFAITVALFAAAVALERSVRFALLAGALMGAAMLVRSPMTFFPIFAVVMFFLRRRVSPGWGLRSLAYFLAAYAVLCPWLIRNYMVMHAFVLVPTRGSMAVWGATGVADGYTLTSWEYPVDSNEIPRYPEPHPKIPDVSEKTYQKITRFQAKLGRMGEIERDRALKAAARQEILAHPGRFAFVGVKKVFRLWFNLWYDWPASTDSRAMAALNLVCLLLAALGYRRSSVGPAYRLTIITAVLYVTAVAVGSCAVVRHSYPVMPMVLVMAASYVAWVVTGRSPEKGSEEAAVTAKSGASD